MWTWLLTRIVAPSCQFFGLSFFTNLQRQTPEQMNEVLRKFRWGMSGAFWQILVLLCLYPLFGFEGQFRELLQRNSVTRDPGFSGLFRPDAFLVSVSAAIFLFCIFRLAEVGFMDAIANRLRKEPDAVPVKSVLLFRLLMSSLAFGLALLVLGQVFGDPLNKHLSLYYSRPILLSALFIIVLAAYSNAIWTWFNRINSASGPILVMSCTGLFAGFTLLFLFPMKATMDFVGAYLVAIIFVAFTMLALIVRVMQQMWNTYVPSQFVFGIKMRWFTALILLFVGTEGFIGRVQHGNNRGVDDPTFGIGEVQGVPMPQALDGWLDNLEKKGIIKLDSTDRIPLVIVVADGGGIHAAVRSSSVLAQLQSMNSKFADSVFATSTVSGGSVGTLSFFAAVEANKKSGRDIREEVGRIIQADLLTVALGKGIFCEYLGALNYGLEGADRGKGLEKGLEFALANANIGDDNVANRFASQPLLPIKNELPALPNFCFNATSASTGDRMVLSRLKLPRIHSLGNLVAPQNVSLLSAACISARFPGVTSPARFLLGRTERNFYDSLLDGGLFDNSGIGTAREIANELSAAISPRLPKPIPLADGSIGYDKGPDGRVKRYKFRDGDASKTKWSERYQDIQICMIVIGNSIEDKTNLAQRNPQDLASFGPEVLPTRLPRDELSIWLNGATRNLLFRNSENGRSIREDAIVKGYVYFDFRWCGGTIEAPLGWYLSGERRKAIEWSLGMDRHFGEEFHALDSAFEKRLQKVDVDCTDCSVALRPRSSDLGVGKDFMKTHPFKQMVEIRAQNKSNYEIIADMIDPEWFKTGSDHYVSALNVRGNPKKNSYYTFTPRSYEK